MNNKIDLLLSFDTTGSMYPVLSQVRQELDKFVNEMFNEFTDLRIGIIAHGDYCDKNNPYTIRIMYFTRNKDKLCTFVRETEKTNGGDADECYELVLNVAHKELKWREDADKIMIMIGDASPHSVFYKLNKDRINWVSETDKLRQMGIKVFAVHALSYYRSSSKAFYKRVAEDTLGVYLTLDQFNEIIELIEATCYRQSGEEKLTEYISIIRDSGKLTHSLSNNFSRLQGIEIEDSAKYFDYGTYSRKMSIAEKDSTVTIKDMAELIPVMPGRFQVMKVIKNTAIKEFVEDNGILFKKGRGFYELSKAETVQQYKEVIMQDRETGEMFTGSQVRKELGLQPQSEKGGVNEKLHKSAAEKFRIFVQSTSINRKLMSGTTFLYEVSDITDEGTIITASTIPHVASVKTAEVKKEESTVKKDKAEKPKKEANRYKDDTGKKLNSKQVSEYIQSVEKVTDGLSRCNKSMNKKNTEYLANNLKKVIDKAKEIMNSLE